MRLWNTAGAAAGYAPLDAGKLDELLLAHPAFCGESTFVLEERGAILGFAAGCTGDTLAQGAVRGYVSCVLLDETCDTAENTALLLGAVEESFRAKGKSVAAVTFFNPLRLPWIIPGTDGHRHNNMPGIAKDIPLYERMLALGYREAATEMAMYLDLAAFAYPAAMEERAAKMAAQGYGMRWRFSPGYGDWPLEQQPELIRVTKCESIGITLSESKMLVPRKSVTAIIGLYKEVKGSGETAHSPNGCAACDKLDCPSRKAVQ